MFKLYYCVLDYLALETIILFCIVSEENYNNILYVVSIYYMIKDDK